MKEWGLAPSQPRRNGLITRRDAQKVPVHRCCIPSEERARRTMLKYSVNESELCESPAGGHAAFAGRRHSFAITAKERMISSAAR